MAVVLSTFDWAAIGLQGASSPSVLILLGESIKARSERVSREKETERVNDRWTSFVTSYARNYWNGHIEIF